MRKATSIVSWLACLPLLACTIVSCDEESSTGQGNRISEVASTGDRQVTGVALSKTGRMFVNFPFWSPGHTISVAEIMPDGSMRPYPNETWNQWNNDTALAGNRFVCVQSVYVDRGGNHLWILDPASPMMAGVVTGGPKLLKVDLATDSVVQIIRFDESVAPKMSYLNDVRIDLANKYAYMTESGMGSLVVTDLATGISRRLLADHSSTKVEPGVVPVIEGKELRDTSGQVPKIHADGIALDMGNQSLYYKALVGRTLYRIPTTDLRSAAGDGPLAGKVENLGQTVVCDGMIMDAANNLYFTAIEENAVRRRTPDGKMELVATDTQLKWPDSFTLGADGDLRVTASMIHLDPKYNNGVSRRTMPYKVFRVDL